MLRSLFRKLRRRSRQKRYSQLSHFVKIESLAGVLLDLGGGPASFFSSSFPRPSQVVLIDVNSSLARRAKQVRPALFVITANGERLPLADQSIAGTICNSVIEHVNDPTALAVEIQRVSRNYFVQTPNGQFPLETHSLIPIPFYNVIPGTGIKRFICRVFGADFEYVSSVRYLSERQLRFLFPNANLTYERFLGLKKSFYLYQRDGDSV